MNLDTLGQTVDCGQCFRWERLPDGSWSGEAGSRCVHVTGENLGGVLSDAFWADYFDMGRDYEAIRERFCALDPILGQAARYAPDLRILNQDPWEALCSFLLSQCNNIKRIKGLVSRLCKTYGESNGACASFPRPEALAVLSEQDLRALGCGYRAGYLVGTARRVAEGALDFDLLRRLPLEEAKRELTALPGVGPKVADCALLYGLHRLEAFPMDVWMKRAMKVLFPGRKPEDFGEYAGVAQQYIFHYSRNHPELF
ncbi:DNA-3-methyladenine glycosylase family protein [Caproicibacter fermentans]|uniref:DNA-(apurinic or apyrimidinic site) lyase n=1 Tax=Caproicibacter fermentans TaxID=2576756 RepID=A0A7G8T722_9FIRM|nr:DNA-3-methyladenine glycosylase 2 family protein [Caproicibacter fermentans]QNK39413.1 DNA-3-methyladenine glycosylase 2 family protein [Caproicibacter fermentans]